MMLGLRLAQEGVDCALFERRFGISPQEKWPDQIDRFAKAGFLEVDPERLRLSERALFLASEVMAAFL
jgi:oxygen-independent coproporphyrinogen-3 oxidase